MTDNKRADNNKTHKKTEQFSKKIKQGIINLLPYFIIFAVTIIFWELLLRLQIGRGLSKENLFFLSFIPAEALALTLINGLFPQKVSRILFPITLLAVSVYYAGQLVYFRIFGSFFSVSMMRMGTDAVTNFGWAMKEVLKKSSLYIALILIPVVIVTVLIITNRIKCKPYHPLIHLLLIPLIAVLWIAGLQCLRIDGTSKQSAYNIFVSDTSDTDTTISRVGVMTTFNLELSSYYIDWGNNDSINKDSILSNDPLGEVAKKGKNPALNGKAKINDSFDFDELSENCCDDSLRELYDYIGNRNPSHDNEYTNLLEGYNVIYICAEGFWSYGINEKVTPTLYKMANNGIVLPNYYNSFLNTTVNGEYAFSTSLWPDVSRKASYGVDVGSMPQSSMCYMPTGLGNVFKNEGVPSYAFHNYYGSYYRRKHSWANLGYENTYFMDDGMTFSTNWPASDYEMMLQSVDSYISEDRFFAYYMTFSGHGPYNSSNCIYNDNIDEVKSILGEEASKYNEEALGYLACNLELEKAMEYLVGRLEAEGIMDRTLIVLTGDHYPYYLEKKGRNSLAGKDLSDMDMYHSTCIMYTTGLKENITCETYCCNVDIIPTVLNLLGIDYDSRLYIGTDVFSKGIHKAVLYDKSFITDKVAYNAKTGKAEWKIDTSKYTKKELDSYLSTMDELIESEYTASIRIIEDNFYYHLWKDSGLMTKEEADAEIEREELVKEEMKDLRSLKGGIKEVKRTAKLLNQKWDAIIEEDDE